MSRLALHGFLAVLGIGFLCCEPAWAQRRSQILTTPFTPKTGTLDALNLVLMWSVDLPMEAKRDGFHDAWIVGGQVLIQTKRGTVLCLDSETGKELWRTMPGLPYQVTLDLAWNNRHVFAFNNGSLHSIDRRNGQIDWRFPLGVTPSAPAAADNQQIYLPIEGEAIVALYLPQPPQPPQKLRLRLDEPTLRVGGGGPDTRKPKEKPNDALAEFEGMQEASPPGAQPGSDKPQPAPATDPKAPGTLRTVEDDVTVLATEEPILNPKVDWMFPTDGIIPFRPLMTKDFVQGINYRGQTFTAVKRGNNVNRTTEENREVNLKIEGQVVVQPVQHGNVSYFATSDGAIFAIDIERGEKLWEKTLSYPAERPLFCTEDDLFVITKQGLTRLDARTGKIGWTINQGTLFAGYQLGMHNVVAVNPKFVYAFDRPGKLHVFERKLGRELAVVDWSDFNVAIPNFSNDRLLLASHSGKLVCLRDRDYQVAEFHGKGEMIMEDPKAQKASVDLLRQPSLIEGAESTTVREVIAQVASRHRVRIHFSDGAFRDQGLAPIADRKVKVAPPGNMPLGKHLETVLTPLGATIANLGGVFMVVPKAGAATATPAPGETKPGEEKPMPMEKPEGEAKPGDGGDAEAPKPADAPKPNAPKANPPKPNAGGLPASPPDKP